MDPRRTQLLLAACALGAGVGLWGLLQGDVPPVGREAGAAPASPARARRLPGAEPPAPRAAESPRAPARTTDSDPDAGAGAAPAPWRPEPSETRPRDAGPRTNAGRLDVVVRVLDELDDPVQDVLVGVYAAGTIHEGPLEDERYPRRWKGPDPGFQARAQRLEDAVVGYGRTDAHGRAEVGVFADRSWRAASTGPATWRIFAARAGYVTWTDEFPATLGTYKDLGEVRLPLGATLSGRVVGATGLPLNGAVVRAIEPLGEPFDAGEVELRRCFGLGARDLGPNVEARTWTDFAGVYGYPGLPAGTPMTLMVSAPGFACSFTGPFALAPGRSVELPDLVLERLPPANLIEGRVRGPDGRAASDVRVVVGRADGNVALAEVTTGSDGAFLLPGAALLDHFLTASTDSRPWEPLRIDHLLAGTVGIELVFEWPERWMDVVVRDPYGRPVPEAVVLVRAKDGSWITTRMERTDAGFRVLLPWIPFRLVARSESREAASELLAADTAATAMELVLTRPVRVSGVVRAGGEPVVGARLRVGNRPMASSDSEGAFELELPDDRPQVLLVLTPQWAPARLPLDFRDATELFDLAIELVRGGALVGRVAPTAPGAATCDEVWVETANGHVASAGLDADGGFVLDRLPPGPATVGCGLHGEGARPLATVEILDGGSARVELRPAE